MKKIILSILALMTFGCTANQRARNFGGTETINLPKGQRFVNASWKEDHLWYVSRPLRKGEVPEKYTFQEKSSIGVIEGTVIFVESL